MVNFFVVQNAGIEFKEGTHVKRKGYAESAELPQGQQSTLL